MIRVFWHVWAEWMWREIVHEQATAIVMSGLYDVSDEIVCGVSGGEAKSAADVLRRYGDKITVAACSTTDAQRERTTLAILRDVTKAEDRVLYLHAKGLSPSTRTKVAENTVSRPVDAWRWQMQYHLIRHHERCVRLLDHYDVVGANFYPEPSPHFSGNFWWARGDYIQKLPERIVAPMRHQDIAAETYIGLASPRMCEIGRGGNSYRVAVEPRTYVGVKQEERALLCTSRATTSWRGFVGSTSLATGPCSTWARTM